MNILKYFKTLHSLIKSHEDSQAEIASLKRRLEYQSEKMVFLDKLIKDRTDIAVDVHRRDMNTVIVVGRYKNADYINCFKLAAEEFPHLIERLKDMEQYGTVRRMDSFPEFRAIYDRY